MKGPKKCEEWRKEYLRRMVDYTCEECHKHEDNVGKLTPHRIVRAYKGGTYLHRNIKMVCSECHKFYHGNEEGCR